MKSSGRSNQPRQTGRHMTDNPITTLAQLARLDIGSDASPADIDYHIGWLLNFTAAEFQHYCRRLGVIS